MPRQAVKLTPALTPYLSDPSVVLYNGDVRDALRMLPDSSVQTCITSPPYWGLRDYGVAGQLGLESTPEEYVAAMVSVFREVRRVLREDGTLWLNLGDTYAHAPVTPNKVPRDTRPISAAFHAMGKAASDDRVSHVWGQGVPPGLKSKDLCGIPWAVAFALRADGWYLRSDIIWAKPNPMPESITDRPTKAHEYIFLFAKSPKYYYDADAIKEPLAVPPHAPGNKDVGQIQGTKEHKGGNSQFRDSRSRTWGSEGGKNRRSVWTITTKPFRGAHFATFPPDLVEPCVLAGCPVGGMVLDPFAGASTTLYVARKLGRRAIGIELNPDYCEISRKRLMESSQWTTK